GGRTQADPSLAQPSGEERDGRVDLVRREPPQEAREERSLLQARARRPDPPRRGRELREEHGVDCPTSGLGADEGPAGAPSLTAFSSRRSRVRGEAPSRIPPLALHANPRLPMDPLPALLLPAHLRPVGLAGVERELAAELDVGGEPLLREQ